MAIAKKTKTATNKKSKGGRASKAPLRKASAGSSLAGGVSPQSLEEWKKRLQKIEAGFLSEEKAYETWHAGIQKKGGKSLRILAEGDSWFDYWPRRIPTPAHPNWGRENTGVIGPLETMLKVKIRNLATAGDEAIQMLVGDQRTRLISELKKSGDKKYDALLFSAGGNDIAGERFVLWLKDYAKDMLPKDMVNWPLFEAEIKVIEGLYRELISLRDKYSLGTKVFVHCYDLPPVTGLGAAEYWPRKYLSGPWLEPGFTARGIDEGARVEFKNAVVVELLRRFRLMVLGIQDDPKIKDFMVVDTQGLLPKIAGTVEPDPKQWANELHPKKPGFQLVAGRFKSVLAEAFPGRVG